MKKCPSPTGFFKVDNLFGELLTEAHKSIARKNLGIDKLPSGGTYGIPIVTESMENKPDKYIIIPDESDLSGSVENKTIVTTNNGTYIDILFSAIRSLQAEIARLKNTFYYGI